MPLSYEVKLAQMKEILYEFQREGSQMLIFKHKEKDVQQNTLMHKAILCYDPPVDSETPMATPISAESFSQTSNEMGQNMQEKKDETKPLNIPPFLVALTDIFPMADVRPFLEEVN